MGFGLSVRLWIIYFAKGSIMSEYQYHEWQTVDRLLTAAEQAAVNQLSSHIDVSSSRAVVTYNWSDFRHDPKQVLLIYFDAYFYLANWGSLRLMFRFPNGLLDEPAIEPYCDGEMVTFATIGAHQVLDIDFNPEDGDYWEGGDTSLSDFVQLRADLLQGDYRLLYLAWLKARTLYDGDDLEDEEYDNRVETDHSELADLEPPVPPGLRKLSPALKAFVDVFGIDPYLVQAAAEASPDPKDALSINYRDLVARLSRSECEEFLVRLAEGDASAGLALRKRLSAGLPREQYQTAGRRTLQYLLQRAGEIENTETIRRAEELRRKYVAEMKSLAAREPQVWQEVDLLLENGRRIASVYNEATAMLEDLEKLANFQDKRDTFRTRLRGLAEKYASRPSLIDRWKSRGWL
jgi:hypothetical protein